MSARRADPIRLAAIDEKVLVELLQVAISDASPEEVMAPMTGAAGWTLARRAAFRTYHRDRRDRPGPLANEITYAVLVGQAVVGAARLALVANDPNAMEVGVWLGRRRRGQGIGTAVLPLAAGRAREFGAHRLIARTTSANHAAVSALVSQGCTVTHAPGGEAEGVLPLR